MYFNISVHEDKSRSTYTKRPNIFSQFYTLLRYNKDIAACILIDNIVCNRLTIQLQKSRKSTVYGLQEMDCRNGDPVVFGLVTPDSTNVG